jgi:hypothetical protein
MTDNLLELAIATTGGRELWKTLRGLRIDISIGGPIWAMKGWPPEKTFDQILTLNTAKEHIVFTPFTRPDQQMVFDPGRPTGRQTRTRARGIQRAAAQQRLGRAASGLLPGLRLLELLHHAVPVHLPWGGRA